MADGRIEIEVAVEGTAAAANDVRAFNNALNTTGQTARATNTTVTQSARTFGQAGTALGQMGNVLGRINPSLGAFGQILGQVGGAVTGLTGAMGPVGVAFGVVTAAVGIASAAMDAFGENARDSAEAARESERSIRDLAEAYREVNNLQAQFAGVGVEQNVIAETLGETSDAVRQLDSELAPLRERLAELGEQRRHAMGTAETRGELAAIQEMNNEMRDVAADLATLERRRTDAVQQRAELEEGLLRAGAGLEATGRAAPDDATVFTQEQRDASRRRREAARGRRRGGGGASRDPFSEESMSASAAREAEFAAEMFDEMMEHRREGWDAEAELRREMHEQELAMVDEAKEKAREEMELRLDMLEQEKAKAREATEAVRDDAMGVLQPVVKGLTGAIGDIISGAKSADEAFQGLLSSFLEMIAQEAALSAAKEFASAIASFASQDYPGGALHLAAGAAWTGVAIAAGAASVAVAPSAAAPASPEQAQPQNEGQRGDVVINWNSPVVTSSTYADLGNEISGMISAGERRYGTRAA